MTRTIVRAPGTSYRRRAACAALLLGALGLASAANAAVALTPQNGTTNLLAPAQPRFTINVSLPNPSVATDANGNSATDYIYRIEITNAGYGVLGNIYVANYNSLWSDPRGPLPSGAQNYTVTAHGVHFQAYSNWIDGHEEEYGHWEWSDEENQDVWVTDGTVWVDGHYETGIDNFNTTFGSASISFSLTYVQGSTSIAPYNGTISIIAPGQPKFTISASLTTPQTATDASGATRTDCIRQIEIFNPTYGWFPLVSVNSGSYAALWTDPRSGLGVGTQAYTVHTWAVHYEAYDNGYVPGHWEDEGHWEWSEEEGQDIWVVDNSWWVDGYGDTGFNEYLEEVGVPQQVTFTIAAGTPQTITFPALPNRSWGEPPFSVTATASSGLPVSFAITSGPATISGNTILVTGVGTVVVTASQPGNEVYSPAPQVSQSFSVASGQIQTITFPPIANRSVSDPPVTVIATSSSGLPVTFSVTGGPATISGSTVSPTGAGLVTITANQSGNGTYSPAASVSRTFEFTKAEQAIAFASLVDRVDGCAPFTISATASSFLAVALEVVSGPATLAGNTVTITGPGVVTIRATQVGNSNFLAAPSVERTFNVTFGPNGHALTVENGTASAIGGNPGVSIAITANIPAGQYFTGWVFVSGDGYICDVANPQTNFTMGTEATTIRATYSGTVPYHNISWVEINLPSAITSGNPVFGMTGVEFSGIATNTGTAPWSRYLSIEILNSSNQIVGYAGVNATGGVPPGGRTPLWYYISAPLPSGTYSFTFRVRDYLGGPFRDLFGSTTAKSITITPRYGTPPDIVYLDAPGTVSVPFSATMNGAATATSFSVVGTMPPGITFNTSTGVFSGTPTQAGEWAPTVVGTSSIGTDPGAVYFRIHPYAVHSLTVAGGSATVSSLLVGSTAGLTANPPSIGQIFNGWSVSGPGTIADPRATTTTIKLNSPGGLAVQANFITGNPLTVVNGTATPMGGQAGAAISIAANPDLDGTMFSQWSTGGPGTIDSASAQNSVFRMGAIGATVTANFMPGYRLTVNGGIGGAAGGIPGSEITVMAGATSMTGYSFEGFYLDGPGYLIGNSGPIVMGKGSARVSAAWWPTTLGALPRTIVWSAANYYFYKNEPVTIQVATDYPGTLTRQRLDYSTDGGNNWILAWDEPPQAPVPGESYAWRFSYTKSGGFPASGIVVFRAKSEAGNLQSPIYFYMPIRVLEQNTATILAHPAPLTAGVGQTASFSFKGEGNGGGDVFYQWRKDGIDLVGKSGTAPSGVPAILTIPNVQLSDAGSYSVAIRSGFAGTWVTSQPAQLTVTGNAPTISVQPASVTAIYGASVSFTVVAGGTGPFTYQWYRNGAAVSPDSASLSTFTIASAQPSDAGNYAVVVRNSFGTVSSLAATLVVNASPIITAQPAGRAVNVGTSLSLSVVATGFPTPSYQWQRNGSPVVGATSSVLFFASAQPSDAGNYSVIVYNSSGSVVSSPDAVLLVGTAGDTDGDGMPDAWETAKGLNPNSPADALLDPDGDGRSNVAEYNLGSDPHVYDAGTSAMGGTVPAGWPSSGSATNILAVGATAGELSVDKNGVATYSIPIWVSPGTAGMQPKLSLNYSSQAGAGIAGFGWSLGGVSSITRGPPTLAVEERTGGVTFTLADRYYLDGQRLIAIQGSDGANETEYRTEIDSFSRIKSYGAAGQGPASFKVWTKSGLVMEYGTTATSAFNPGGRLEALSWAVSKISDTSGNSIRFEYEENTATGEHYLKAIRYTERPGVSHFASVILEYEPRTDTTMGYVAGALVSQTQRLKRIKACYNSAPNSDGTSVRTYELAYTERENSMRSLLTKIEEIAADGTKYPPLVFAYETPVSPVWRDSQLAPRVPLALNNAPALARGTGFVDLDGDGRPDFVRYHRWNSDGGIGERDAWVQRNGTWVLADGSVSGVPDWRLPAPANDNLKCVLAWDEFGSDFGTRFVDLNGDGRIDVLHSLKRGSSYYSSAYLNTPNGWVIADGSVAGVPDWRVPAPGYLAAENDTDGSARIVDINGDGRPDIVWNYQDNPSIRGALLNTGSGWTSDPRWTPPFRINADRFFVDLNGDRYPDQVVHWYGDATTVIGVALNSPVGWSPTQTAQQSFSGGTNPIDLASATNRLGPIGRFLPPVRLTVKSPYNTHEPIGSEFVDVNGDGLLDVVFSNRYSSEGPAATYLNTGDGWIASEAFRLPSNTYLRGTEENPHRSTGAAWVDANGDGILDLVIHREADTSSMGVYLGTGRGFAPRVNNFSLIPPYPLARSNGAYQTGADLVDLDGDGTMDQVWYLSGGTSGARLQGAMAADRLRSATNGYGVTATIAYAPLTERDAAGGFTVYDRGTTESSDTANLIGSLYVVKSVTHDDGANGQYPVTYRYGGLRTHRVRGNLGFNWVQSIDGRSSVVSTTNYRQDFPFIGMPTTSTTKSGSVYLNTTVFTYASKSLAPAKVYSVVASETLATTRDANNAFVTTVYTYVPNTAQNVDDYGNIKTLVVEPLDEAGNPTGFKTTTVSTYQNDTANWFLGRLLSSSVTSEAPGPTSITRKSGFLYDTTSGLLTDEAVEPEFGSDGRLQPSFSELSGYSAATLRTHYEYDEFGNRKRSQVCGLKTQVSDAGVVASLGVLEIRESQTLFEGTVERGRFPSSSSNALSHTEVYDEYDRGLGVLKKLKGPNGLETAWIYDGFGRKKQESRADGTSTLTLRKWAGSGDPTRERASFQVETVSTGAAPGLVFFDSFGREIRSLAINGAGEVVYRDTDYDNRGRTLRKSNPYRKDGQPIFWTENVSFDVLNRPLLVRTPDDAIPAGYVETASDYNGLVTTLTDPKLRVTEETRNPRGWVVSTIRNKTAAVAAVDYAATTFVHDAVGNVISTNASGTITGITYDVRGRKTSMTEPNMGQWQYQYSAFGELIWQKDAKGQIVRLAYDVLGRLTTRVESEGTTQWSFDNAPHIDPPSGAPATWRGLLHTVTAPGGYSETHSYDSVGRISGISRSVAGEVFATGQGYDTSGRPERTIYPGGFQVRNHYNDYGFVKEVRRSDGTHNDLFWQAESYAADGRVDGEMFGNGLTAYRSYSYATGRLTYASVDRGVIRAEPYQIQQLTYTYDAVGNVKRRYDAATGIDDRFTFNDEPSNEGYDGLDRLKVHRRFGGATLTFDYDQRGNLTYKSDVGSYTYGTRPNAVTQAGANSFQYDANGNMTSGAGRAIAWTSFNQVLTVTQGSYTSTFIFGASHERVKQTSHLGTTIYIGNLFEKVTNAQGALVEYRHFIFAPTGRIAVYKDSGVATSTQYFHTDGLGSIAAVTDDWGRIVGRYSYDAWGKRTPAGAIAGVTRGFTDHEHLDDLGLIHMNGRVYDPTLGRFLSADTFVGDVSDSQDYNRYSYLGNNPLGGTDPSGYFSLKDGLKIVGAIVAGIVTAGVALYAYAAVIGGTFVGGLAGAISSVGLAAGWGGGWAIAAGAGFGFGSAFAGSLLNGGSIGDAFKAGVVGGIVGGISAGVAGKIGDFAEGHEWFAGTGQSLAHGALQGGLTEATGGEFRHGFYAGFASSALAGASSLAPGGTTGQTVAAAVIGGTASAIGGGKFANGAVSGAFTYMFNHAAHAPADNRDWLDRASDFAAGFGDTISFGATRFIRNHISFYDGTVNYDSASYTVGEVAGVAASVALGGAGSLNAGARSVFYSGKGALEAARAGRGAGLLLENTAGGKVLNVVDRLLAKRGMEMPQKVWDGASWVFARNAKLGSQAFLRSPMSASGTFYRIEQPILEARKISLIYR